MANAATQQAVLLMEPPHAMQWVLGARNRQRIARHAVVPIAPKWIGGQVNLPHVQVGRVLQNQSQSPSQSPIQSLSQSLNQSQSLSTNQKQSQSVLLRQCHATLENHNAAMLVHAPCMELHHATQQALGVLSRREIVRGAGALYVQVFRCSLPGERRSKAFYARESTSDSRYCKPTGLIRVLGGGMWKKRNYEQCRILLCSTREHQVSVLDFSTAL